jgi:hypothetical protein
MATAASLLYSCPDGDYDPGRNPSLGRDDNQSNGTCVKLAGCETDPVSEITNTVKNFLKDAKKVLSFAGNIGNEVQAAAGILKELGGLLVGSLMNRLTEKLKELIQQGVAALLASTGGLALPSIVTLKPAVQALIKGMVCLMNKIIGGLFDTAVDLLSNMVGEIQNFASCAAEQFTGAFINPIIDQIADGVTALLGPLEKIISPAFKIVDFLLGAVDAISAIGGLFQCNESKNCPTVKGYFVGGGFCTGEEDEEEPPDVGKILAKLSIAKGASNLSNDFQRQFGQWDIFGDGTTLNDSGIVNANGSCYTGNPLACGAPKITIFGGGGVGAAGKAILGGIVDNTEGLSDVVSKVGSVVGVDLLSGGSGYKTAPFVTISDSCGLGRGAFAKANINEKGEVTSITMISSGLGYPVNENIPLGIVGAVIENGGSGFDNNDTLDGFDLTIEDGIIIDARINRVTPVNELPALNVNTKTGSGARIKPLINSLPVVEKQLQEVIDCIE